MTNNEKNFWIESKKWDQVANKYEKVFMVIKASFGEINFFPEISLINGKTYKTKLGEAMSIPLNTGNIEQIIETLQKVQQFFKEGKQ
jgi:hypothetical protein